MGTKTKRQRSGRCLPAPSSGDRVGTGVTLQIRCVFCRETLSTVERDRSHLQSPGPKWWRGTPRPRRVVTALSPPSPGHCRGPRPEQRRLLPTAPPRGLRPNPAAPVQSAESRSRPFRVASSPRDTRAAGDEQGPDPGHNQTIPHKNARGRRNVGALSLPQPLAVKSTPGKSRPRHLILTPNSGQASLQDEFCAQP